MAHSSCTELNDTHKSRLLQIARDSITHGLTTQRALTLEAVDCTGQLGETLASFVTLTHSGALRGCIGSLSATRPLARDVAHAAFEAAFRDPRFAPLSETELDTTTIEISVLTVPEPLAINSEQELLERLVPHQDGLVLEDGRHRATYLPKVWEQLPEPKRFLTNLKHKAGLSSDYWSDTIRVLRYRTISFSEHRLTDSEQILT